MAVDYKVEKVSAFKYRGETYTDIHQVRRMVRGFVLDEWFHKYENGEERHTHSYNEFLAHHWNDIEGDVNAAFAGTGMN